MQIVSKCSVVCMMAKIQKNIEIVEIGHYWISYEGWADRKLLIDFFIS